MVAVGFVAGCDCNEIGLEGRVDSTTEISQEDGVDACGNGLVDGTEECDGDVDICPGLDHCPGYRLCREDCTWGDCEEYGFGVLSGPVRLSTPLDLAEVRRTSTKWTGNRFGVFYSGEDAGPPSVSKAWFTGVDNDSIIEVETHEVIPLAGSDEIDAAWYVSASTFRIALSRPAPDYLLFSLADERGEADIEHGEALGTGEIMGPVITAGNRDLAAAWQDALSRRIVFARFVPSSVSIYESMTLDALSSEPIHYMPSMDTDGYEYAVLWHVDDPAESKSFLRFARVAGTHVTGDIKTLFTDYNAMPPSDICATRSAFGVIFATEPFLDSPVLDLHFALLNIDGDSTIPLVDAGCVRRSGDRDAAILWNNEEFAIVSAAPSTDEPDANRVLLFQRFGPEADRYSEFAVPIPWGDVSIPSLAWDGEGYGVSYAVRDEHEVEVEFIRLGCLQPD